MAVPAKRPVNQGPDGKFTHATVELNGFDRREIAARLYGMGFKRSQIALKMLPLLSPSRDRKSARGILRRWEQDKDFRDMVYKHAVVELDMSTPQILAGIKRAAQRGRVDAAKLALGVTERYTDKSDQPQEVLVRVETIPRPNDDTKPPALEA